MAFKKGISGNPGGKSKYKTNSDALRVGVNRIDPNHGLEPVFLVAIKDLVAMASCFQTPLQFEQS